MSSQQSTPTSAKPIKKIDPIKLRKAFGKLSTEQEKLALISVSLDEPAVTNSTENFVIVLEELGKITSKRVEECELLSAMPLS